MSAVVDLSIVAPFFNEAETLPRFLTELIEVLTQMDATYEVILADDGSTDNWREVIGGQDWSGCRVVELTINAGHQAALDAGLRESTGKYVVTMDSDLQHPPQLLPTLFETAQATNCDVVYAKRGQRLEDSTYKRITALGYYRAMRWLTGVPLEENAADYRLMSRFVVDVLNTMPDRKVFRLLLPSLGFPSQNVFFEAASRQSGSSKYTTRKMLGLAARSSVQFSRQPLRLVAVSGLFTSFVALLWFCYVLVSWITGAALTGWTSIMAVTLFTGGAILFSLGVMGEYIGEIYESVKGRPSYLVRQVRQLKP